MAVNLVVPEVDSAEGYEQPVNPSTDGLASAGFYPQSATPGTPEDSVGIERDVSNNLILKDGNAGTHTLSSLVGSGFDPNRQIMTVSGEMVYIGDGDILLKVS
jgi:hypothetical protein